MEKYVINNLFEFWKYIGVQSNSLYQKDGFSIVSTPHGSWPDKIFDLDGKAINFNLLNQELTKNHRPNSFVLSSTMAHLIGGGYEQSSSLEAMALELLYTPDWDIPESGIVEVTDKQGAFHFAQISTRAFGYHVSPNTIEALLGQSPKIKMYIGIDQGVYASTGMLFLDSNGYSGLHMIGTLPNYQGRGLGKRMTLKLLAEAVQNKSEKAVLVASKAGAHIYKKLGFKSYGTVNSYSVKQVVETYK